MESCRTGADILREEGYSFPCLSADINDPMLKEIGINVFPTVLIIDPDGDMVFRGDIEHAGKYLRKLAEP